MNEDVNLNLNTGNLDASINDLAKLAALLEDIRTKGKNIDLSKIYGAGSAVKKGAAEAAGISTRSKEADQIFKNATATVKDGLAAITTQFGVFMAELKASTRKGFQFNLGEFRRVPDTMSRTTDKEGNIVTFTRTTGKETLKTVGDSEQVTTKIDNLKIQAAAAHKQAAEKLNRSASQLLRYSDQLGNTKVLGATVTAAGTTRQLQYDTGKTRGVITESLDPKGIRTGLKIQDKTAAEEAKRNLIQERRDYDAASAAGKAWIEAKRESVRIEKLLHKQQYEYAVDTAKGNQGLNEEISKRYNTFLKEAYANARQREAEAKKLWQEEKRVKSLIQKQQLEQAVADARAAEAARKQQAKSDAQRVKLDQAMAASTAKAISRQEKVEQRRAVESYAKQSYDSRTLTTLPQDVRSGLIMTGFNPKTAEETYKYHKQLADGTTIVSTYTKKAGDLSNQYRHIKDQVLPAANSVSFFNQQMNTGLRLLKIYAAYRTFNFFKQLGVDAAKNAIELDRWASLTKTISQDINNFNIAGSMVRVSNYAGKDLKEAGEAFYNLMSNQVAKGQSDANTLMMAAADFGKTTNATLQSSVDLISAAMNAYKIPASDATKVAAQFFTTIDLGRVKANELANSYGRVAIVAEQLGISSEELQASLAMLTIRGMDTAEALTQIRGMMTSFLRPTEKAQKQIEAMGFASGQQMSQLLGLGGALKLMAEHSNDLSELSEFVPRVRGLSLAALIADPQGAKEYATLLDKITNSTGNYQNAIEIMNNSAAVQVATAKQRLLNGVTLLAQDAVMALVSVIPELGESYKQLAIPMTTVDYQTKEIIKSLNLVEKATRLSMADMLQTVAKTRQQINKEWEREGFFSRGALSVQQQQVEEVADAYGKMLRAPQETDPYGSKRSDEDLRRIRDEALDAAEWGADVANNLVKAQQAADALAKRQTSSGALVPGDVSESEKEHETALARIRAIAEEQQKYAALDLAQRKEYLNALQAEMKLNLESDKAKIKTEEDLNKFIKEREEALARLKALSDKLGINNELELKSLEKRNALLEQLRKPLQQADTDQRKLDDIKAIRAALPAATAAERVQQLQRQLPGVDYAQGIVPLKPVNAATVAAAPFGAGMDMLNNWRKGEANKIYADLAKAQAGLENSRITDTKSLGEFKKATDAFRAAANAAGESATIPDRLMPEINQTLATAEKIQAEAELALKTYGEGGLKPSEAPVAEMQARLKKLEATLPAEAIAKEEAAQAPINILEILKRWDMDRRSGSGPNPSPASPRGGT